MKPTEVIGDCQLYQADCLEVMPQISRVDSIVTDPPYLVSKGGFASNLQLEGGFGGWMKEYGNQGDIVGCALNFDQWAPLAFNVLSDRSQAYFMTNGRNIKDMQAALEAAGFRLHTVLVWDKRAALPNKYYQNVTEFCLFVFKGRAFTIHDPGSKNLISLFQKDESDHPTEKPVELMAFWIKNSTKVGDTVLDPFMGSGSSGVACVRTGRKFVGVELDSGHFDTACRRIETAVERTKQQPDFFVEPPSKPVQEAMDGL